MRKIVKSSIAMLVGIAFLTGCATSITSADFEKTKSIGLIVRKAATYQPDDLVQGRSNQAMGIRSDGLPNYGGSPWDMAGAGASAGVIGMVVIVGVGFAAKAINDSRTVAFKEKLATACGPRIEAAIEKFNTDLPNKLSEALSVKGVVKIVPESEWIITLYRPELNKISGEKVDLFLDIHPKIGLVDMTTWIAPDIWPRASLVTALYPYEAVSNSPPPKFRTVDTYELFKPKYPMPKSSGYSGGMTTAQAVEEDTRPSRRLFKSAEDINLRCDEFISDLEADMAKLPAQLMALVNSKK